MEGKYNHKLVENGKNAKWIKNQYFSSHNESKIPFTIILPPPNVTGKLHLGHAWGSYIQDTIIRYKKINGYDVMWIPGIDHAGIATQAKVETKIRKSRNLNKEDLGREKFLQEVWNWKEKYALRIRDQWNQLGLAFDYENERFTMDAGLSKAVLKVFINLYNRKLIYRSKRAINYDVKLKTVLSNIEVENREVKQKLYYIKYKLENGEHVTIATVRPETLFSDVALAINSNDKRYKHLVGKHIIHPLLKTRQPIITNDHIETDIGTGIMKVSAHSIVDIQIIMENNLEINECIDNDGILNARAMEFKGLERIAAREKIIAKLRREGMIEKVEDKISAVGFSQRSNSVIEILVKPQWFVKMDLMAKYIFDDYKKEGIKFFPNRFCDNLKRWMENVYDWCISRQLWWGHRIPAWYKNNEIKVQINSPGDGWKQDEDVLDTWFSSGLAPFSFLGWPSQEKKLKRYYPTNLLVTGYDIIFFWVARMYFQGLDIMKEKPFKEVLIHGIFRDNKGQKMSKSLGNGVDPSELIEKYGSDTLRWMLLVNSTPGLDINYSEQKIKSAWNFINKLWNIARYILLAMDQTPSETSDADAWINNKLLDLKTAIDKNIANYEFTIIGKKIQKFIIEDLSSWYIEITKTAPNQVFAKTILEKLLIILHPFLPFITDHIFKLINGQELLERDNPKLELMKPSKDINKLIAVTKILRRFRDERSISKKIKLLYWTDIKFSLLEIELINKLAKASLEKNNDVILPYGQNKIFIKQSSQELAKAQKFVQAQTKKLEFEINRSQQILSNKNFIKNAPEWKVVEEKTKLQKYENELKQLATKK